MRNRIDGGRDDGRRGFLRALASGTVALAMTACASGPLAGLHKTAAGSKNHEEDVSPAEDLMREHGALKRILMIYGEALRRFDAREDLPVQALRDSAGIIRSFIENYHEKLEEDHLFPRFRKAGRLVDLVGVLQAQHQAGRRLTDVTLSLSAPGASTAFRDRRRLADSLRQFIRMYSPHEVREDTVLFPAIREVFSPREYNALGDRFEDREHELFGDRGFETMVERVAAIEKSLGIYDLAQFTPTE